MPGSSGQVDTEADEEGRVSVYRFEADELDPRRRELRRGGRQVHVEPQVFDVLALLLRHRDRVVAKSELLDEVWGDRFVSESALIVEWLDAFLGADR